MIIRQETANRKSGQGINWEETTNKGSEARDRATKSKSNANCCVSTNKADVQGATAPTITTNSEG